LAVAVTLATPRALVVAVPLDNTALAPLEGAVKATTMPLNGLLFESLTVTWRALGKAVPAVVDCGVPPEAVTLAGWPPVPEVTDAPTGAETLEPKLESPPYDAVRE
jgi:hypothetical protein